MSEIKIGRLIRSSSTDFVFGATIPEKEVPAFGSFVRSSLPNQQGKMFGVIFNLTILNSEFLRHSKQRIFAAGCNCRYCHRRQYDD